jgi:TonB family protein
MKLLIYLVECSLALGAFYAVYFVFLRKQTHFAANRFYLLFTLPFSMILPAINIRFPVENPEAMAVFRFKEVVIGQNTQVLQSIFNLNTLIIFIFGLSSSYFLFRLLKQLWSISKLVRKNQTQKIEKAYIIEYDKDVTFSFFNYIFINREIVNLERQRILLHEKTHVEQWHTIDKMISELILVVQWFNPFAWLYRNALGETHEYLADSTVGKHGINMLEYQQLLLNQMFGTNRIQFVQYFNFNQSLIKKRIMMMTKNEHSKPLRIRFLMALPLAGMIIALFAFKASIPGKIIEPVKNTLNDSTTLKETDGTFVIVDVNAQFQGGDLNTFRTYIMQHVKYPEKARKMGIEGKVMAQFVVDRDGNVINVKILRSLASECDAEVIRVIQASPKWVPGIYKGEKVKQQFVMPVVFKLQNTK